MKSSFLGNNCDKARLSGHFVLGLHSLYTHFTVGGGGGVGGRQSVRGEGRGTRRGEREKAEERRRDGERERACVCAKAPCKEQEGVRWTRAGNLLALGASRHHGSLTYEHLAAQSVMLVLNGSVFAQCVFSTQTNLCHLMFS